MPGIYEQLVKKQSFESNCEILSYESFSCLVKWILELVQHAVHLISPNILTLHRC